MKKLLIAIIAFIPVIGFAQSNSATLQRQQTATKENSQPAVQKNAVALPQPAAVVLTEEEAHAQWLKNNSHFKTMSVVERSKTIQQLEEKLSYNLNTPAAEGLQREIKWIKELETVK